VFKLSLETEAGQREALKCAIDNIWDTYDVDRSGALDKEETKRFVKDTMGSLGGGDVFNDQSFDQVFALFDADKSGTIERPEMVSFVKQLMQTN
jgi:Ca2+-binding EF-hand superfamily protein